jgi:hypothetical protein
MRSLAVILLAASSGASAASVDEWRQDIDKLVADIRSTHPDPFAKIGELQFLRAAEALKAELPALSEEQRMTGAMRLVASIGDGHTRLEPVAPAFARWYPFRAYEFEDGFFLTGVHQSIRDLAGTQLIEIGGRPAGEVVRSARSLHGADNGFDSKERLGALHNSALMTGLGHAAADGTLTLKLRLRNGRIVTRKIAPVAGNSSTFDWFFRPEYWGPVGPPEEWVSAYRGLSVAQLRIRDDSRPLHIRFRRAFLATAVPESRAYYIQSNVVGDSAEESMPSAFRRALKEVDQIKPDHLIVDIRFNFGGDGSNVIPVVNEFIARLQNPPWKNLYFITGRRTFSAGMLMTSEFLKHVRPTLVGEPAGAPLNSYGDANSFDYKKAGMHAYVSFERHQTGKSTDLSAFIPVDYPARWTFADYAAGRDTAVEAVFRGDARSLPAIAAMEGASTAEATYRKRKAEFASDPTWRPTSEIDLRTVMRDLRDAGRNDAAIEVAKLNTLVNPQEWRTWMNLGDLLMKSERKAEAIDNYRKSLELNDPTNFNADRLKQAIAEFEKAPQR